MKEYTIDLFGQSVKVVQKDDGKFIMPSEVGLWDGYGSGIKPGHEPLILAMKPCIGTFAENAIESGVAGLNIDGCRIGIDNNEREVIDNRSGKGWGTQQCVFGGRDEGTFKSHSAGRWPANLILSHHESCLDSECHPLCPVGLLDEQSADKMHSAGSSRFNQRDTSGEAKGMFPMHGAGGHRFGDSGGASRFFYCAKVSTRERNIGGTNCKHPTLKPIDLCRYLATLLLPPLRSDNSQRRIIIPFSGAGSEVIGAKLAGWEYIHGIENDPEYYLSSLHRTNSKELTILKTTILPHNTSNVVPKITKKPNLLEG